MAKNTKSAAFRKVDVDQYDDESFVEEQAPEDNITGPNDTEVQSLLSSGKNMEALKLVLSSPPISSKNQALKDKIVQTVLKVLLTFKSSEIENCVNQLESSKLDVLMKFIYRGFEFPSENSSAMLLIWHDKVFSKVGLGCIVRALTDRKQI